MDAPNALKTSWIGHFACARLLTANIHIKYSSARSRMVCRSFASHWRPDWTTYPHRDIRLLAKRKHMEKHHSAQLLLQLAGLLNLLLNLSLLATLDAR